MRWRFKFIFFNFIYLSIAVLATVQYLNIVEVLRRLRTDMGRRYEKRDVEER